MKLMGICLATSKMEKDGLKTKLSLDKGTDCFDHKWVCKVLNVMAEDLKKVFKEFIPLI